MSWRPWRQVVSGSQLVRFSTFETTYDSFYNSNRVVKQETFRSKVVLIIEPPHEKKKKKSDCAPSEDSDHAQSDQSLRCPHEESLGP